MRGVLLAAVAALCGCDDGRREQILLNAAALPVELEAATTTYFIDGGTIPRIVCPTSDPDRTIVGSGIRIGSGMIATANHVVEQPGCRVDGETPTLVMRWPGQDFALVYTHPALLKAAWTCKRPMAGGLFFVSGYADAVYRHRSNPIMATSDMADGFLIFEGDTGHGTSGGPVTGMDGVSYGVVVAKAVPVEEDDDGQYLAVRLFADTALCKGKKAGPAPGGRKAEPAK